ncbi:MAG: sigma-54-dependent Fis family transcriptional regulator [Desulfobacteraceae bacterium]|nr:MAG: sigma-54-dependent Fis family transcriptional regulator [Desulfobacteraceae bacterium]
MKKVIKLLIIDDDDFVSASLSDYLINKGFGVRTASNGKDGIASFEREQPSLVLLDQKLPDMEGVNVCQKILEINPNAKIIFITAYATVQYAVEAMQAGASHYLSKPFELDELSITIDMALKNVQMEGKLRVQDYEREKDRREKKLIGSSEVINRIKEQIELAAGSEATVLLTGETGVGKNVVAIAIHDLQAKRETYLTINCSAIPENLMEAEYFGHEKGVFTGAETRREGIFELSDGGTLVLDEIGDIPIHLQSKLLTALEDKTIRRIGSGRVIPVDVRVIATTNENLEEAIREKRFRQDLYYRLAVLNIHIPPLRDHPEDISEISDYFVKRFCRGPVRIPDSHIRKMMKYPWPGNVRELRNVIERAALLLQGDEIRPADLLLQDSLSSPLEKSSQKTMNIREIIPLEEVKRRHILSALRACSGNKSLTARSLGVSLSTLKRKLREMNIT